MVLRAAKEKRRFLRCTSNLRVETIGIKVGEVVQMATGTFSRRNMDVVVVDTVGTPMISKLLVIR
tara:strand:- start:463 stop:657 length:195 start_codon:yes stop_codon:yes gene_type:complete